LKTTASLREQSGARELAAPAPSQAVARFGFLVFLASESMLFAGLLGALAVFRLRADRWPPLRLSRLPGAVTAATSLLLFASTLPITNGSDLLVLRERGVGSDLPARVSRPAMSIAHPLPFTVEAPS